MSETIRIGISSCLLGANVRYDGGHQRDRFITDTLSRYVEFVPVCPEVEMGLPIPREALRLVGDPPRLMTAKTGIDLTDRMTGWAARRLARLEGDGLCGFIFKKGSPSSGMARVKLYDRNGVPQNTGIGLFARLFMQHFPLLPVEEDGRLNDPQLREHFIERIFVMRRWRDLLAGGMRPGALVEFHTRHKYLLLAHSPEGYRRAGRLVARARELPVATLFADYQQLLMQALNQPATVRKHANVLQHMLGYFKKQLAADEKLELLEVIDAYRHGLVPLIVPMTLVGHYVRKYRQPYLAQQVYLNPHPLELKLRNHA